MSFEKIASPEIKKQFDIDKPKNELRNNSLKKNGFEMQGIFSDIYKNYGVTNDTKGSREINGKSNSGERFDKNVNQMSDKELYKELGLKNEDREKIKKENGVENEGTYTDLKTGKEYASFAHWLRAKYIYGKRMESAANDYWKRKADREWAIFKNAEKDGIGDDEKSKHYHESQRYYDKMKECNEKADLVADIIFKK